MLYEMVAVVRYSHSSPNLAQAQQANEKSSLQIRPNLKDVKEYLSTLHPRPSLSTFLSPLTKADFYPSFLSSSVARSTSLTILKNNGVIRGLTNWGSFLLTKPVYRNAQRYDSGHHFILRFDASPAVQQMVKKNISVDPRAIRVGIVKMGKRGSLREICEVDGRVGWRERPGQDIEGREEWWETLKEGKGEGVGGGR